MMNLTNQERAELERLRTEMAMLKTWYVRWIDQGKPGPTQAEPLPVKL